MYGDQFGEFVCGLLLGLKGLKVSGKDYFYASCC